MYIRTCVCMYAWVYVCMYACVCICMCVFVSLFMIKLIFRSVDKTFVLEEKGKKYNEGLTRYKMISLSSFTHNNLKRYRRQLTK